MMIKLLTAKEISEMLSVRERTVYGWAHMDFIPHYKLGKCIRFREEDVVNWLELRRAEGRSTLRIKV